MDSAPKTSQRALSSRAARGQYLEFAYDEAASAWRGSPHRSASAPPIAATRPSLMDGPNVSLMAESVGTPSAGAGRSRARSERRRWVGSASWPTETAVVRATWTGRGTRSVNCRFLSGHSPGRIGAGPMTAPWQTPCIEGPAATDGNRCIAAAQSVGSNDSSQERAAASMRSIAAAHQRISAARAARRRPGRGSARRSCRGCWRRGA